MTLLTFILYFIPTIIVIINSNHPNRVGLFLLNLFFGWTIIGWLIALIWAFSTSNKRNAIDTNTITIINQTKVD